MNLKEKIEENLTLSILIVAIAAFGAGWTAYDTVTKAGNNVIISANDLAKLKDSETQLTKLQGQVAAKSKQKIKVVFVDARKRVYFKLNPEQYPEGNADFLVHHIKGDSNLSEFVDPVKKLTSPLQPGSSAQLYRLSAEEVEELRPDIIVIHRSAFYEETEEDKNETRLVEFLKGMKRNDTTLLLYSRKAGTDGKYAYDLANSTGLENRLFAYQFREGYPFDDRAQVDSFFQTFAMLVHARMNQKQQSSN